MLGEIILTAKLKLQYLFGIHHFDLEDFVAEPVVLENYLASSLIDLCTFAATKELV
jgi:hypothetical protein